MKKNTEWVQRVAQDLGGAFTWNLRVEPPYPATLSQDGPVWLRRPDAEGREFAERIGCAGRPADETNRICTGAVAIINMLGEYDSIKDMESVQAEIADSAARELQSLPALASLSALTQQLIRVVELEVARRRQWPSQLGILHDPSTRRDWGEVPRSLMREMELAGALSSLCRQREDKIYIHLYTSSASDYQLVEDAMQMQLGYSIPWRQEEKTWRGSIAKLPVFDRDGLPPFEESSAVVEAPATINPDYFNANYAGDFIWANTSRPWSIVPSGVCAEPPSTPHTPSRPAPAYIPYPGVPPF